MINDDEIKEPRIPFFDDKVATKQSILALLLMIIISTILSYLLFIQICINNQTSSPHFDYTEYNKIAIISDIHLDPNQNETSCRAWKTNKTHYNTNYGIQGCDPPYQFMHFSIKSFSNHIKELGNVKLVFHLGDDTGHEINGIKDTLQMISNNTITLQNLRLDVPIYSTIGNNDFPTDYMEPHNKTDYYDKIWQQYCSLLSSISLEDAAKARETFVIGGYYKVNHTSNLWIISLNTVSFSKNSNVSEASGMSQLEWLFQTLSDAQKYYISVIIIGHVPPGLSFFQLRPNHNITSMLWKDIFIKKYNKIVSSYSGVIKLSLFSHQHADGWFAKKGNKTDSYIAYFTVPSISEVYENIPSYTFGIFNDNWELVDIRHYQCPVDYYTRINQTPRYIFHYSIKESYFLHTSKSVGKDDLITADFLFQLTERIVDFNDMLYVFKQRLLHSYQLRWLPEISPYQMYCSMTQNTFEELLMCLKKFKY